MNKRTGIDLDQEAGESAAYKSKIKKARRRRFKEWLQEYHPDDNFTEAEIAKDVEKAREEPGGSNVGKERESSGPREGPFCGPSGGAPKGSYPVTSKKQAKAAKAYAHNAPNPEGIKSCADRVLKKK